MTVSDRDLGFAKVMTDLKALANKEIKIGIQGDAEYEEKDGKKRKKSVSVLDVAVWNEFGTSNIPSRPFIRQTFELDSEEVYQQMAKVVEAVGLGVNVHQALSLVGQWYEGKMKHTLTTFPWKLNAASTIKRKKSSNPLIDTEQLRSSIRYEVK